jgi:hypothetical protein
MPLVEFEPTIPARARPQTHALDRAATGIGFSFGNEVIWAPCDVTTIATNGDKYQRIPEPALE